MSARSVQAEIDVLRLLNKDAPAERYRVRSDRDQSLCYGRCDPDDAVGVGPGTREVHCRGQTQGGPHLQEFLGLITLFCVYQG